MLMQKIGDMSVNKRELETAMYAYGYNYALRVDVLANEIFVSTTDPSIRRRVIDWNTICVAEMMKNSMNHEPLVGLAQSCLRNGRPASEDPEIRQRLAALEGYVRAHEYSSLRQLSRSARGKDVGRVGRMNKLVSTNIGCEVAKIAIDLLQDDGMLDAQAQEAITSDGVGASRSWLSQYMYSLGIAIAGGTANIQRNVIGERALGLPRDHYAQRSSGK